MWVENKAATFLCFEPLKKRILKTFDEGGRPRLTLIFVNLKFILFRGTQGEVFFDITVSV
jgi:hypothetical protein